MHIFPAFLLYIRVPYDAKFTFIEKQYCFQQDSQWTDDNFNLYFFSFSFFFRMRIGGVGGEVHITLKINLFMIWQIEATSLPFEVSESSGLCVFTPFKQEKKES